MKRIILGVVLASVAAYMWGFVVWGLGPYHEIIWKRSTDDVAAGAALRNMFPENGVYYVPGSQHEGETATRLWDAGPVAMVHMIAVDGRAQMDSTMMVAGAIFTIGFVMLLALMLQWVVVALPGYGSRVAFVTMIGIAAAALVDLGDIVWWQFDWKWMFYRAGYHATVCLIAGLVLAGFIRPPRPATVA
ncbi:MAG: hypothetical protein WDZ59_03190 [Pirellulales bacterium]